jgi:predicted DsbA family dithiol-disulfide isomerase
MSANRFGTPRRHLVGVTLQIPSIESSATGTQDAGPATGNSIEVYADISCPFAHLSLRTVAHLRDDFAPTVPILVRAWPLELVNGKPLDPLSTALHVHELRRDVAPDLFAGFRPDVMPVSTLRALALVEGANEVDPWQGERLSLQLRTQLFEEGRRLDDGVLERLANENSLDPSVLDDIASVEARLAEGRRRGVRGSPHFYVGDNDWFCPLLDIERDHAGGLHIEKRVATLLALLVNGLGLTSASEESSRFFGV